MFHQVKVPEDDMNCLRFYWWPDDDLSRNPEVYRMAVHLFGAKSSPSCSNTALRRTAIDNNEMFKSDVVNTVLKNFYVDDCLKSYETEADVISMVQDLIEICRRGGFNLTKWVSNSHAVLESVPNEARAKNVKQLDLSRDHLSTQHWKDEPDALGFQINIQDKPPTRRDILSVVSSVFDPIGLAAPFILPGKILLQELCHHGIGWDDEISKKDLQKWHGWEVDLPQLKKISVPRCFKPVDFGKVVSCQVHNFSDASERGYGMVSYLRLVNR
ncbi:uncharacterized protein LOC100370012 [Saccoglossus kowalevskii]|uniref:Uncharacterized protein LOC100370012 n=1 Tax=Saccoglossus kowalevskii TaxID=10224 RepID=A0ABM0M6Y7_SACKO|nr:PREDICTED: uncharacterized protein LOC100370012 [Saccoglossus kowalevskii]